MTDGSSQVPTGRSLWQRAKAFWGTSSFPFGCLDSITGLAPYCLLSGAPKTPTIKLWLYTCWGTCHIDSRDFGWLLMPTTWCRRESNSSSCLDMYYSKPVWARQQKWNKINTPLLFVEVQYEILLPGLATCNDSMWNRYICKSSFVFVLSHRLPTYQTRLSNGCWFHWKKNSFFSQKKTKGLKQEPSKNFIRVLGEEQRDKS